MSPVKFRAKTLDYDPMTMPDQHAKLSPSAAHRWMHCPAAPSREAVLPEESSIYAEEGTLAHAIAAAALKHRLGLSTAAEDAEIEELSPRYDIGEIEAFTGVYVDYVWARYKAAKGKDASAVLLVEQRLALDCVDGFGTSDAIIAREGELDICDLKYGKGVKVDAVGNPQMRIYALGAMEHLDDYDFSTIRTHIIQPRLNHTDCEEIAAADLRGWERGVLLPAVAKTSEDGAPAVAGGWCQFCKDKQCLTRARSAMSLVATIAPDANKLTPDAMARDVLPHLAMVKAWVTAMEGLSLDMAKRGDKIPGYKLVEGRKTRTIADLEEAGRRLIANGADIDAVAPRKTQPLTSLEKVVGKREFAAICGDLISVKEGAPKLVADSDPGTEIDGASVFSKIKL